MSQEELTQSTSSCPHCGALDQKLSTLCMGCGRFIANPVPYWAQGGKRHGIFGRQGLIFMTHNKWLLIVLIVLIGSALAWHNYHVIPNPVALLLNRPSTDLSSLSAPGQWAMTGEDFERTRYVEDPPALPQGRLLWSTEPDFLKGVSLPAVVDGTIYVGSHFEFLALDANTGRTKWTREMSGLINSSPTVAGDKVYVGSTDTKLWVFDRFTGETEWTFPTGNYISSSALITNGFLFIGSGDHAMYALDAENGEELWHFETSDLITSPPSLHNGVLYFTSNDNSLYSVNYRTGEGRMQFRTRGTATFEPAVVANGLVYMASVNGIQAARAGLREIPGRWQGEQLWRTLWLRWGSPIPRPTAQYGTVWRFTPEGGGFAASSPAVTEDAFYVGDSAGRLFALGAKDASEIWTFHGEGEIRAAPIVAGNTIYFGTTAGLIYAIDRQSGRELWNLSLGSPITLAQSLAEGKLFVRTGDGRIHAVE